MTTGTLSSNEVAFIKDGWTFYDYSQVNWTGDDTPPSQRPKDKVTKSYKYYVTEVVNGHRVPVLREHVRTRLVPSRSRLLPPHPFEKNGKVVKQDWFQVSWPTNQSVVFGLVNELPFTSGWSANDDIKLLSKLRAEVAGSDFNAGVTLGESVKTLNMISEHTRRIYHFFRNFRKGNFRRASEELLNGRKLQPPSRAASSNWLAMKYGWLPLLNDVSNGAQFLAHNFNSPRVFRVVVTKSKGERGDSSYDYPYFGLPNGTSHVMAAIERKESKRIVALLTEVNVPALAGLRDPASVAWELVPYSFVIDWFIPVGNWLSARGLAQSLTGTFVTSYVHKERLSHLWIKNVGGPSYTFSRRMERGSWERWHFKREVSTTLPVPIFPNVKPLGGYPSWEKAVTSLALLMNLKR